MALHAVLAKMLEVNRQAGRPALSAGTPEQARALLSSSCAALGTGPAVGAVVDVRIPTRGGSIGGRLFAPAHAEPGLIIYVHGGGWVIGTLSDFDALARALVARSGRTLLLVDYRLAPEHPFPAGLEDVEDAIRWAFSERSRLAGDGGAPLVVAGDSAGANLATVAAAALKDELDIALQLLFYPVTDCDTDTPCYRAHAEGLFITRADMQWFFRHYAPEQLWADPRISPLRSEALAGVAPAWIATAEYDVLCDEGEAYARRLEAAGVPVELRRYAGVGHGFVRMMNFVDVANEALDDAAAAISRRCAAAPPRT